jgi:hypothetical protein
MITPADLALVGEAVLLDPSPSSLRRRFPALHFSESSDDDVSPRHRPAFGVDGYNLYLVTGHTGHCLELTSDHDAATGLLIAAVADES